MARAKSNPKTINIVLLLHDYSFINLEKYFSLKSKEGGRVNEVSTGRTFPLQRER
jgi:hypothetical protein